MISSLKAVVVIGMLRNWRNLFVPDTALSVVDALSVPLFLLRFLTVVRYLVMDGSEKVMSWRSEEFLHLLPPRLRVGLNL